MVNILNLKLIFVVLHVTVIDGFRMSKYVKVVSLKGGYVCATNPSNGTEKVVRQIKNGNKIVNYKKTSGEIDGLWCLNTCLDSSLCSNIQAVFSSPTMLECNCFPSFPLLSPSSHPCIFYTRSGRLTVCKNNSNNLFLK